MAATGRHRRVVVASLVLVAAMAGLAFASVPLYRLFCAATGFGGTTQRAEAPSDTVAGRPIAVRFNADVARDLPWRFEPVQREIVLPVGETALVYYRARNNGSAPMVGTATFNVTPDVAGIYFSKIQCFCFTEQRLAPGESVDLPVQFFVDPALLDDPETKDLPAITLSYTFFRAPAQPVTAGAEGAAQKSMN
jgi:cytochrome c oxidase assembly protein subunit 11